MQLRNDSFIKLTLTGFAEHLICFDSYSNHILWQKACVGGAQCKVRSWWGDRDDAILKPFTWRVSIRVINPLRRKRNLLHFTPYLLILWLLRWLSSCSQNSNRQHQQPPHGDQCVGKSYTNNTKFYVVLWHKCCCFLTTWQLSLSHRWQWQTE